MKNGKKTRFLTRPGAALAALLTALLLCLVTACPDGTSGGGDTEYTVKFNSGGGSEVPAQTIEEGGKVSAPATPTKTADGVTYTFTGWYKEAALTNDWNFALDTVTANTTLYAGWVTLPDATPPESKFTSSNAGVRFYTNDPDDAGYFFWVTFTTNSNGSDTFAIQAKRVSGNANYPFGLVFATDDKSYYSVQYTTDGYYLIEKRVPDGDTAGKYTYTYLTNGEWKTYSQNDSWSRSSHFVQGLSLVNALKATRTGSTYTVFVNNQEIARFTDSAFTGSNVGMYVSVGSEANENFPETPVDVRFKQLTVTP